MPELPHTACTAKKGLDLAALRPRCRPSCAQPAVGYTTGMVPSTHKKATNHGSKGDSVGGCRVCKLQQFYSPSGKACLPATSSRRPTPVWRSWHCIFHCSRRCYCWTTPQGIWTQLDETGRLSLWGGGVLAAAFYAVVPKFPCQLAKCIELVSCHAVSNSC